MKESENCSFSGCERNAGATLGGHSFCLEHFIFTCFERLDECQGWFEAPLSRDPPTESIQQILAECTRQATDLANRKDGLTNLERARLIYIPMVAADLGRRLRKGSRKTVTIPLRLRCAEPGRHWEQDAQTRTISRRGALIECTRPVGIGEKFFLVRLDTGGQATAQVVWHQCKEEGRVDVGIEFVDCKNFWQLDWDMEETSM